LLRGQVEERLHAVEAAEEVDRQDRLRLRAEFRRDGLGPQVVRIRMDVDENRLRAEPGDGARGREERVRRRHDLVAGAEVQRHEGMLVQWNAAADARDFKQQQRIEIELNRYSTPHYAIVARDAIEEKDDDRRNLAVWSLAFCRQMEAAEVLKRVLDDPHPQVR